MKWRIDFVDLAQDISWILLEENKDQGCCDLLDVGSCLDNPDLDKLMARVNRLRLNVSDFIVGQNTKLSKNIPMVCSSCKPYLEECEPQLLAIRGFDAFIQVSGVLSHGGDAEIEVVEFMLDMYRLRYIGVGEDVDWDEFIVYYNAGVFGPDLKLLKEIVI